MIYILQRFGGINVPNKGYILLEGTDVPTLLQPLLLPLVLPLLQSLLLTLLLPLVLPLYYSISSNIEDQNRLKLA